MFANKIYREGESERERAIVYTIVGIFGVGLFVRLFVWYTILRIYENRLNAGKSIGLYAYSGRGSSSWSNFDFLYGFNLVNFAFFDFPIYSHYRQSLRKCRSQEIDSRLFSVCARPLLNVCMYRFPICNVYRVYSYTQTKHYVI